jgi:hypothetical protein
MFKLGKDVENLSRITEFFKGKSFKSISKIIWKIPSSSCEQFAPIVRWFSYKPNDRNVE